MDILKRFGLQVRELRLRQNFSQEELAYRANLHRTYIGMIERGEKNLSLKNIEKLCKALNVQLEQLFKGL